MSSDGFVSGNSVVKTKTCADSGFLHSFFFALVAKTFV